MNIVLINAAFNYSGGIKGHGGTMMPLNLCYLAAYARQQHPSIQISILDSEIKHLSHDETVEQTAARNPALIGITVNTCIFDSVSQLILKLKQKMPLVPIVIGGPHASALPELSLKECLADFAVIGEGELTFSELIGKISTHDCNWNGINGLAYRDKDARIHVNAPRGLIEDLDILPFPARNLIETAVYSPPPTKRVSLGANTLIATSRGCPHNCGFCGAQTVWTRRVRVRKPVSVVAEIEECIAKYSVKSFNFTDEFFTANKRRVLEICELIRDRKLDIAWVCSARAQNLDSETLKTMKAAGCHEISFGIESGNQDILKRIDKSLDLNEAERVIRLTKKAGISTHASYILGYLGETEETIQDTIRFAKKLNTEVAAFFIASPLPGTPLYREAREKGFIRRDATWSEYSPLSNGQSVLNYPHLSNETIRKWHRKALKSYYFRISYIVSRIIMIRHWYEIVNLFAGLKTYFQIKK